jgi:glycosyltransferase 2 family protein
LRRILFLAIGLVISVGALYFAFQGFDLGGVWDAMGRVRLPFFLLMLVPYVLTFLTKVWRWQTLFYPDQKRAPFRVLFPTLMLSYVPLPFRLGEVARGVAASARTGVPIARVFSTIFVEKVLDVLTLLLLLGVSLPFVELSGDTSNRGSLILVGVVVLLLVAAMIFFVLRPDVARSLVQLLSRPFPERVGKRLLEVADNVLDGLAPLADPSIALRVGLWSLATWLVNSVTVYLELLAFNMAVTPAAAVLLVVGTNLSMAVPAAPGYIGTFEVAVVGVLVALGQPVESSQAFAIIYHFVGLVPVAVIGVIAALQQGINFASLSSSDQTPPANAPTPNPQRPEGTRIPKPQLRDKP